MTYHSTENRECYFPPMLSNGDISFAPDAEGMLGYSARDYQDKGFHTFDGIVVRSARRTGVCNLLQAKLFPLGRFTFGTEGRLSTWSQTLRVEKGCFESVCDYEGGEQIASKGFIHPDIPVYALQKRFERGSDNAAIQVTLCGYNDRINRYINVLYVEKRDDVCCIGFQLFGMEVFTGEVRVWIDKAYTATPIENGIKLSFNASAGEKVAFYYCVEDDLGGENFLEKLKLYEAKIKAEGFDGLLAECVAHFRDFYDLGYVKTSDETLNSIYNTSLYSVKCSTTRDSIAVGLNNNAWDGRFFAFDEYSSYLGFLSANRHALAKRVPSYRLYKCLPTAIKRASDSHRNEKTEDMVRFHWESGEYPSLELAPAGHWQDHIFHLPLVGIGAFNYYEYTEDAEFLRECYPMIRGCAKFMTKHMLYRNGDRLYIGKCTDLERLGSSVENPFMTTCGAIKLLECCARAAEILGIDAEYAAECVTVAQKLYENLPIENNRYVPFLGCEQKSIAVFAGKYPFEVLDSKDQKMLDAWEDFEINGAAYGNMYPVGGRISSWYACWKAEGYARAGMKERAYEMLKQAYPSAGVFSELFEINERGYRYRPWFTTAAGIFVSSVNDMLLQSDGKTITLLPGMPHSVDVSFCLAAKGGITVEAEVRGGQLIKAVVLKNGKQVTEQYKIEF